MTHLEWTDPAVADLENIHDYLARDSHEYAQSFVERLILSVERLRPFPERGRLVPEAPNAKVRELMADGYRLIYRVRKGRVQMLAVVHGARQVTGMRPRPWDAA